MAASGNISRIAERYAGALFDLAREKNAIDNVEQMLTAFQNLLDESPELKKIVTSPLISSLEQRKALETVFEKTGIDGFARDFIFVLAKNRRLFLAERVIIVFKRLLAHERGEIEASIVSATALSPEQEQSLSDTLRQKLGKTPRLALSIDPKILGGLVVKIGSQMIDTSLRTKLKSLELAMKEAG